MQEKVVGSHDCVYSYWCVRIITIFAAILTGLLFSQTLFGRVPRYHEFVSIMGGKNIPMSGITSLTLDDNGFVWGASRMGIVRATTSDVFKYELPVSTSDIMQMKLAYNKGVLAAATQNGQVFIYDRIKDRFEQKLTLSNILGNKDWISNIVVDNDGVLWISTSTGLFTYSDSSLNRLYPEKTGYSYIVHCEGNEMFAIADNKVYVISDKSKSLLNLPGNFDRYVSSATYDSNRRRILMGTYQGELWEYRLHDKVLSPIAVKVLPELIIRSILVPDSDAIFIGMEGGGIIVLDAKDGSLLKVIREDIDDPASLKGNSVFAMVTDLQGRLWVATTSAGLQYSDADGDDAMRIVHRHNSTSSLHNNEINFLLTDKDGNLWAATNDGISRRDARDGSWSQLFGRRQLSVLSLTQDNNGRIYATTYGDGIYVIDPVTCKELNHFSSNEADIFGKGAYVFASFLDSDGDIWFGGVKGDIVCYSPKSGQFRKFESHPVFCFAEERPGVILTGGGDGLISIDKETGKAETILPDNVVQKIMVDGSVWWICTSGNGVICMDQTSGKNNALTVNDGLHSNFTRSLIRCDGKLWIGTALGMSCYDINKGVMLQLPGKDILTSDAFRENSSCVLPDGKLAFGTNNGIVTFRPDKILDFVSQGKIFFSDIKVSGRSIRTNFDQELTVPIDSLKTLVLNYPRNAFTLSMQALGDVGSNVMYSWRLDGVDKEWSEPSSTSSINYINLNPDSYKLRIRMYDGRVVSERELTIKVNPPFWNTLWFRIIVLLAMIGLACFFVRHYILSMRRKHAFEKLLLSLQIAENAKDHPVTDMNDIDDPSHKPSAHTEVENDGSEALADRVVESDKDDIPAQDPENSVIEDEFLARAMECVRENISNESFGKGDFASAMMISQSLLYKKIKAATDMSVVEFIRSIRLNHAMTLLRGGKYNVTEVSEICGFSSSAYFSKVFKESFGKSPSEMLQKS